MAECETDNRKREISSIWHLAESERCVNYRRLVTVLHTLLFQNLEQQIIWTFMELDHLLIHTVQQNTQNNKEMIHQRNMRRAMTMTMMMRKVRIVTWTMMMIMMLMKMMMLLRIVTLSWAEVHEESSSPFEFWVHSEYLRIVIIIIIIITIIIIMMLIADH